MEETPERSTHEKYFYEKRSIDGRMGKLRMRESLKDKGNYARSMYGRSTHFREMRKETLVKEALKGEGLVAGNKCKRSISG